MSSIRVFAPIVAAAVLFSQVSPAFAQDADGKVKSTPAPAARAEMDSKTAASVKRRETIAWTALAVGGAAATGLATAGSAIMDSKTKECEELPDASYEKGDCLQDAGSAGLPFVILGGVSLVAGITTFLIVRPSAADRDAAERASKKAELDVRVDPERRAYSASVRFAF